MQTQQQSINNNDINNIEILQKNKNDNDNDMDIEENKKESLILTLDKKNVFVKKIQNWITKI